MYISKYNITFPTSTGDKLILNPLWGSMDLLGQDAIRVLDDVYKRGYFDQDNTFLQEMLAAGYISTSESVENEKMNSEYKKYKAHIASMPENFFIIPTYGCNLACIYCFQNNVPKTQEVISDEIISRVFAAISQIRSERNSKARPQITIYGGEPLQHTAKQISAIGKILTHCMEFDYKSLIVTNGVTLSKYSEILKKHHIGEIHVTLDGTREVHDARRMSRNKKGTFDQIVRGIESALQLGLQIHLRIVVDKRNIENLPELIVFLDNRGWLDIPQFRIHVGRTNECGVFVRDTHYLDRIELLHFFVRHEKELKGVDFGFRGIKRAILTGELPAPLFNHCPSCVQELVFDLHGNIYACPGACGQARYQVGRFSPSLEFIDAVGQWQSRSIMTMEKCRNCDLALVCGGGCPLEGLIEGKGLFQPDCLPIREEMQLGVELYSPFLLNSIDKPTDLESCSCSCSYSSSDAEAEEEPATQKGDVPSANSNNATSCNCNIKIIPLDEENAKRPI